MMKKKKHSRSQSSIKKTLEPSSDSSLLSIFRSKLVSGKDLKQMFKGVRSKNIPGLSSQSRIVRCPKCHKLLQEPIDATTYKCSGCDSILQAKRWELESNNNNNNSIPEAFLSSQNRNLSTEIESAERGSKTPNREYNRHDDDDADVFVSARSSPYNSRSHASEWTQHEYRYEDLPRVVPFYPASPSPSSSAYDFGYNSPFHSGSQASASEQSYYYHQQQNQFKQYGRESWFQESSVASPIRFPGETSDRNHNHWSSQSQLNELQYEHSNSATTRRSVYSERSYQATATPHRPERSVVSEKSSLRDKKKYVREKNQVVKRYVLPSAGGAPFATCSYCLELLQLPQVSPRGKHKRYQVRCGSCSGVLKFSIQEKADNILNPSTGFSDEIVTIHQDSASESHEEIYQDDRNLSSLDNSFGSRICKEDVRSISSKILDSKLEALQPQWKHLLSSKLREQHAISETIEQTSRIHLEKSEEAHTERSSEMFGDGLDESLDLPVDTNQRLSESSIEAETVVRLVSDIAEPLNKNEYIYETLVLPENTRDIQELELEEIQESERRWEEIIEDKPMMHLENSRYIEDSICDSSSSNSETVKDKEVREDTEHLASTFSEAMSATQQSLDESLLNENRRFNEHPDQSSEATVTISRNHEEHLCERQELDKTIVDRVSYELEESRNQANETLELSKSEEDGSIVSLEKVSDTFEKIIEGETGEERLVTHQVESPNENVEIFYETLEPVLFNSAGERTWEETTEDRAGLHLDEYESNYENFSKSFDWTSERAPTFSRHEYDDLETILESEEDADGRSESSSRDSSNDNVNSEEQAKAEQSQCEYENSSKRQESSNTLFDIDNSELQRFSYETNETLEPSETGEERAVSHQMVPQNENLDNYYRTVEPVQLEGSRYATERTWTETIGDSAGLQLEEYQSNPSEWSSETAPTLSLHEYKLGTISELEEDDNGRGYQRSRGLDDEVDPWLVDETEIEVIEVSVMVEDEPSSHLLKCEHESMELDETFVWTSGRVLTSGSNKDANGRSTSSSTDPLSDHESSKQRNVSHEKEPWLLDENKIEAIEVSAMAQDELSQHVEKCKNESTKSEETFEWRSERAPTFRLHEYELSTMSKPDEAADTRSESSSRNSFDNHGSSKVRSVFHEEPQIGVNDGPSLHLDEFENEEMKLDETFEWTPGRSLTFRLRENEPNTLLEQDEAVDIRSESSSNESFNDVPTFYSTESSSKAEEKILGNHLEHLKIENENSGGLTTEPSEIVGLRHALYETQTSPLRTPLTSPFHTPIGSPLHYMRSPMHSHIVSPLRSPINIPGSLSDVLFFSKKG